MTDVLSQTPPVLHGPSEKERRYDRQLRLWAASGQAALESANILLVNSPSTAGTLGVETLKNLVLPGIGRFTIADEATVQPSDLGVNFFLDQSCLGKSRAQCCTDLLLELNPDAQGEYYPHNNDSFDLSQLLQTAPTFTMILYVLPLPATQIHQIQEYASHHKIPLIAAHSAGFYSYFSISLPGTFPIVDTHPDDTATADLRLLAPWPELSSFAAEMTKDIDSLDAHQHGHLPLVVILLHYLEAWKKEHEGAYPTSYADKTAFRKVVSDAMRTDNPEGGEENFEEAVAAVMKHVTKPSVPSSLQQVFDYAHDDRHPESGFWIVAEAVKQFHQKHERLPVPGGLPDMKAQSDVYIKLQNIYKSKARADAAEILETVQTTPGGEDIDPAEVDLFCTNARFIKLINSAQEPKMALDKVVEREFQNDEVAAFAGPEMPLSLIPIYLALTATSTSTTSAFSASDITSYITERVPLAKDNERVTKAAEEVARAAGAELHNISAVMGGMVAQEMIKIVTKQYIAVDNTCVFDGIESRCQVLRL